MEHLSKDKSLTLVVKAKVVGILHKLHLQLYFSIGY